MSFPDVTVRSSYSNVPTYSPKRSREKSLDARAKKMAKIADDRLASFFDRTQRVSFSNGLKEGTKKKLKVVKAKKSFSAKDSQNSDRCLDPYNNNIEKTIHNKNIDNATKIDRITKTVSRIHLAQLQPNRDTYNLLLSFHIKLEKFDSASQVLNELKAKDLKPKYKVFCDNLNLAMEEENIEQIFRILGLMRESKIKPNIDFYQKLMTFGVKVGNADFAFDIFQDIIDEQLLPDEESANVLLNFLASLGDLRAFTVIKKMMDNEQKPDENSANLLLDFLVVTKNKVALNFYKKMIKAKITPDEGNSNNLLELLVNNQNQDALFVFNEMIKAKQNPNSEIAILLLRFLKEDSYKKIKTLLIFLLDTFIDNNNLNVNFGILEQMQQQNNGPHTIVFDSLRDYLVSIGNKVSAVEIIKKKKLAGLQLDKTDKELLTS